MPTAVQTTPILIVDDDEVLGHVLSRVLTREGRTIVQAASATQALELAQQHHPRLALLDLRLPDGDGIELAGQLRAKYADLPLILMTAYPLRLRDQPELAEHFTRVLTKPLNLQELRQAVDAALAEDGAPAHAVAPSRPRTTEPIRAESSAAAIGSVTIVSAPPISASRPNASYRKWVAYAAVAAVVIAVLLLAPPLVGIPGVQALWTAPERKERVEPKTVLGVDLVKGQEHTLSVPADVLASLGIRKGKVENVATAEKPTQGRPLVMPGSTAQDDTRLSRVRVRFNAQVIEIRKIRPHPELGESDQNEPREILTGDTIKEGQTLAVLHSFEVANMKSTLVNAWVQLYFDQDVLERLENASIAVPDILLDSQKRLVRGDQTAIASSYTTLRTWGFSIEDLRDLRKEADELTQLHLKSKKDKAVQREEEAAWAVKKDEWMRVDLKAPRSGTLVERNISLREFVADNTQPLFQIAEVGRMVVFANPAENDLPALLRERKEKKELYWTVHTVGLPAKGVVGPISEISYFIDQNQHTAVIKGFIENPEEKLRAGQFASVLIELPAPAHTVAIPINALDEDGKQSIVFVVTSADKKRSIVEMRRVIVTQRFANTAYVLSDFADLPPEKCHLTKEEKEQGLLEPTPLEEGARVITSGVLELKSALEDKESAAESR